MGRSCSQDVRKKVGVLLIILDNRKIKIATEFKYLGITLQPIGKCFTKHVTGIAANSIIAINNIKNIQALSLDTAMKLFRAKILPMLSLRDRNYMAAPHRSQLRNYGKGQSPVLKKSTGALKDDKVTTSVLAG